MTNRLRVSELRLSRARAGFVAAALAIVLASGCASRSHLPYLGEWRVISFSVPGVSALTESHATNWIGTVAKYDKDSASFGHDECPAASYATKTVTPEQFAQDFRVNPADLHITASPIPIVTVTCATPWTNHGSVLIVKGPDGLLTVWDGAVFELQRRLP